MKIENQLRSYRGASRTVTKTDKTQAGKFQQLLGSMPEEPKDTITISYRAPAAEETSVSAAALGAADVRPAIQGAGNAAPQAAPPASPTEIQPGDTTEVKLAKLQKQAEEVDYTGMTYNEIYTSIWNRYNDAFDGNWTIIEMFPEVQEGGDKATSDFRCEVGRHVVGPMEHEFKLATGIDVFSNTMYTDEEAAAYGDYVQSKYGNFRAQVLGYEGMTMDEMEQAIYEKYAGQNTLRSFLGMQAELIGTGVMGNKLGGDASCAYQRTLHEQLIKTLFPDIYYDFSNDLPMNVPQYRWDYLMDQKFDPRSFAADMRETVRNTTYSGWDFDIEGAISQGIDYLLEAVAKAQLAAQERHAEQEKRIEQAELIKQAE